MCRFFFCTDLLLSAVDCSAVSHYNNKEGKKRRKAEIIAEKINFGDSKKEDDGSSASAPTQGFGAPAQSGGYTPNFGSAQPSSFVPNFGGNY